MSINSPGDIIRLDDIQSYNNLSEVVNVYHFQLAGEDTCTDAELMAAMLTFVNGFHGQTDDVQSALQFFVSFKVTNLTTKTLVGLHTFSGTPHGTISGDAIPPGAAGLVTFSTGLLKARGRKFIAGIATSLTSAGIVNGLVLSSLADYAAYFIGLLAPEGIPMYAGVVAKGGTFAPFVSAAVRTVIAYQRRRKQGVGV